MTAAILTNALSKNSPHVEMDERLQSLKDQALVGKVEDGILLAKQERSEKLLADLRLPSRRDEEWQFTDLTNLKEVDFSAAQKVDLDVATAENFYLPEASHSRLVFVNGFFSAELSDISDLPDSIICGAWANLPLNQREKLDHYLAQQVDIDNVFSNLNTAGLKDSAIVSISTNVELEIPIHCLFLTVADPTPMLVQPRLLVVAESNAKLTIVESYGAITSNCTDRPQQQPYFNNIVSEIYLGENARVTHVRNQRDSGDGFHIATTAIAQGKQSRYQLIDVNLGAKLSRHSLQMVQEGEATETEFLALTTLAGRQVSDTHSTIALNHPHGITNQLHKCIVDEHAQAVFSGKVLVPQAAQLTNAQQLNRNLLLSSKARINTKPELQITADNVKCSHGATVSQLEADEVFYLRSRGLNDYDARHLLIDAFAGEILDQIPLASLRGRLRQCISCRTV
ncbi:MULTISPECIES: Fe-S cluster assembly protein SufD [unclassified Synechocystis]|uniref:Fe-S cluster assembly protein SufD n=1 Tax=unclassified Synechocystis TaxID=2640012 RepID=UPI00041ACDFE|nr:MULTISPECIES: Fe-S cluster assembly protein SufD [unclassified Synechocystis]AIE73527.1 Iron-sulfur cluster assembly protein SufD [Synechocystis sp. PCC 6714]MCT0254129.1 Fe-S cluster assembly protein SufD [Synechocystis sp. CS-94]